MTKSIPFNGTSLYALLYISKVQLLAKLSASFSASLSYNKPTQRAGNAHKLLQGPVSAPLNSINFLSLISVKIVLM